MENQLTFGEYVRQLRRRKKWGLQSLSEASHLSLTHLSRLENDSVIPNAETVVKLAGALDGNLEQMLTMANCLPKEILDRLVRRAGSGATAYKRTAGPVGDPDFPQALVEDIDPTIRAAITRHFGLSDSDVEGLFSVLRKMARMAPADREAILGFLGAKGGEESAK